MKGQILSKERMFCAFFCWENAPKIIWTTQIHHKYVKLMSLPLCVNLLGSNNNSTKYSNKLKNTSNLTWKNFPMRETKNHGTEVLQISTINKIMGTQMFSLVNTRGIQSQSNSRNNFLGHQRIDRRNLTKKSKYCSRTQNPL